MARPVSNDALEQRIYAVERGQTALGERVEAMATGLDARIDRLTTTIERRFSEASADRKPQWQAFSLIATVAIAVMAAFGGLSMAFIQAQIGGVNDRALQAQQDQKQFIPRTELQGWRDDDRDRFDRLSQSLMQLRTDSVSQAEHMALTDRMTKAETAIGSITPTGNVIQDVLDRLKRLEERPFRGNWNQLQSAPAQ